LLLEFVGRLAPAPTPGAIARNLPPLVAEGDLDGAPCLRAFIFELSRPCGVFGPVLFWAFRLSAAFCFIVVMVLTFVKVLRLPAINIK
jgi:hypothetical protein